MNRYSRADTQVLQMNAYYEQKTGATEERILQMNGYYGTDIKALQINFAKMDHDTTNLP